jgi:hypothetical protein
MHNIQYLLLTPHQHYGLLSADHLPLLSSLWLPSILFILDDFFHPSDSSCVPLFSHCKHFCHWTKLFIYLHYLFPYLLLIPKSEIFRGKNLNLGPSLFFFNFTFLFIYFAVLDWTQELMHARQVLHTITTAITLLKIFFYLNFFYHYYTCLWFRVK